MARNGKLNNKSALHRVKRMFTRSGAVPASGTDATAAGAAAAPPKKRQTDIPFEVLDAAYTPPLTSSKASFRSDGSDHQLDQEFSLGRTANDWNDEDRYTNKSGDPRIGTHGRTYERS